MLKIYKLEETAKIPSFGTDEAACFDTWTGENPLDEQQYAQLIQQKYGNICNWLGIWQSIWT